MRILVTNDDGIDAPGLKVLETIAATLSDDVTVVAPSEEMSGAGHSLTLTRPLRIRHRCERRFAVTGTPTDSVMMALGRIMKDGLPDLILSGVNRGANLAEDVTYSGTVSAAMEGALAGIPSVALSQVYAKEGMGDAVPFDTAAAWGERVLRPIVATPLPRYTLVNVNFPAVPADQVKGIKVCHQGIRDYGRLKIVEGTDPRGFPYYWFGLGVLEHTPVPDSDIAAVRDGHISVTPLHLDMTHEASLKTLAASYGG